MKLQPNTTVGDLKRLLHRRQFAPIKDRMMAVVLRRTGKSLRFISAVVGRSVDFVKQWNDRFKNQGAVGLYDRSNRSKQSKLTDELRADFRKRVIAGPTTEDQVSVFRISDLQRILKQEFGTDYSLSAISKMLRRMGLSRLRPRPKHEKNDAQKITEWQMKTFPLF